MPGDRVVSLTPADVAERWNCSRDVVLRLIRSGKLAAFSLTPGKAVRPRWRCKLEDVEAYEPIQSNRVAEENPRTRRMRRPAGGPYYYEY